MLYKNLMLIFRTALFYGVKLEVGHGEDVLIISKHISRIFQGRSSQRCCSFLKKLAYWECIQEVGHDKNVIIISEHVSVSF